MASTSVVYNLIARDNASKTFGKVADSSSKLEKGLGRLGSALKGAAIGIGAADLAGAAAVKMAANFETQMTRVKTGAGELQKNMAAVSSGVLKMAGQVGQSTSELTSGLYTVESAGYHGAAALNVLKASAMGAKVGAAELSTVTDAVTTGLNAYHMGADKAVAVTNALIGTEAEGKTTMEALAGSLSTILPTAAAAHVGLNEVLGAMATMTSQGTPAAQAATYLRQVVGQLSNPSAKAADEMKSLGLSATKVGLELGKEGLAATLTTLTDAIQKHLGPQGTVLINQLESASKSTSDYQKVLANLSPTQQTYIGALATMVGGTRSMQGALELTGTHMKTFQADTDGVAEHVRKGGAAIEGWSDVSKTFNQKLSQLKDGTQALAIQIGTKMLPAVTNMVGAIGSKALPAVGRFAGFLTDTAAPAVGHFSATLVNKLVPIGSIKKSLSNLSKDISGFFSGLSGKSVAVKVVAHHAPIDVPQSSGEKLGDQFHSMFSDGLKGVDWSEFGKSLAGGVLKALEGLASMGKKLMGIIGKVLGGIDWLTLGKDVGATAIPFVIGFVNNLLTPLMSGAFWAKNWKDILLFAITFIPVGKLAGPLAKIFEKLPILKAFAPLLKGVEKIFGPISDGILKGLKFVGQAFIDGFAEEFDIAKSANGIVSKVIYFFYSKAIDFGDAAKNMIGGFAKGLGSATGNAVMAGLRFIGKLLEPFAEAGSWLISKGSDLISGLLKGALKIGGTVVDWTKTKIIDLVLKPWVDSNVWLYSHGMDLIDGLFSGALKVGRTIGSWMGDHVINPVTGAFSRAGHWLLDAGGNLLSGLKNGIVGAIKGISGWVKKSVVDPVVTAVKHWFGIHSPSTVFAELGGHLTAGLLKGMASTGGTAIAKMAFGDLPHALESMASKGLVSLTSLPKKAMKALASLGGGFKGSGASSVDMWSIDVATALSQLGLPASAMSAVLTRIGIESGGNPNAINNWDSNAKAGHPSQGLMQTIPSTFAAYAGPYKGAGILNPLANIYAGINYAVHRYGKNWLSVMTRPGGYAKGGLAPVGQTAWVGERGPELMQVTGQGTRIISNRDSMKLAKGLGIRLPGYASGTVTVAEQRVDTAREALERARERRYGVQAAETRYKAAVQELKNAQASSRTTVSNALANGYLKSLETGTSAAIASAVKSMNTKLQNTGANSLVAGQLKASARLQSLAAQKASLASQVTTARSYASDQTGSLDDYLSVGDSTATTVSGLLTEMKSKQQTAKSFATEVSSLAKRGLSKSLLSQLAQQGPGGQLAAVLKNASSADIRNLDKVSDSGTKLATSFGQTMADAMYDSGKQAGKGFLSGLLGQEKTLQQAMDKIADGMVKAIKKKLKIKSPSGVMRDEVGRMLGAGLVAGMDAHGPQVAAAAQRMADTATTARYARAARPGAAGAVTVQPIVHVHVQDPALRDLIRIEVEHGHAELAKVLDAGEGW